MQELWTVYGFYLWALTTALVVIALAWLAWNTFGEAGAEGNGGPGDQEKSSLAAMEETVASLGETLPYMQATLGRALQRVGVAHGSAPDGTATFAVAVTNARGDGFILSGGGAGSLNLKILSGWRPSVTLSREESSAVSDAQRHPAGQS